MKAEIVIGVAGQRHTVVMKWSRAELRVTTLSGAQLVQNRHSGTMGVGMQLASRGGARSMVRAYCSENICRWDSRWCRKSKLFAMRSSARMYRQVGEWVV